MPQPETDASDGRVDAVDFMYIIRTFIEAGDNISLNCDIDGDGIVSVSDPALVKVGMQE